jgi:hypothetical protein
MNNLLMLRTRLDILGSGGPVVRIGLPPSDLGRADSNRDSNVCSQPPPLTHNSIQLRSGMTARTGSPLRLKSRRSRIIAVPPRLVANTVAKPLDSA